MNLLSPLTLFASGSDIHIPPIQAEGLFHIGPVPIHNSTIFGWFGTLLVVATLIWVASKVKLHPSKNKLVNIVEAICEYIIGLMTEVMQSRKKALRYAPLIFTLFFVILINNWFELLPGVGHSLLAGTSEGDVPLLRGFPSDVNNTIALALVTMILVQIYSIREVGGIGFFKRFFSDKPYNPVNIFIGLIEVISEMAKVVSLSLRLFGNLFAGEVLLVVVFAITNWLAPIATVPFWVMVAFDGFIQAFVFAMLAIVYITIATIDHSSHGNKDKTTSTSKRNQAFDAPKLATSSD